MCGLFYGHILRPCNTFIIQ